MSRRLLTSVAVAAAMLLALVTWAPTLAASAGVPSGASVLAETTPDPCPPATPTPQPTPTPTPVPTAAPGETAIPTSVPVHTPGKNLCGAPGPGSANFDPITGLLAWLFTPIFQALFIGLAGFYTLTGDIGIAIVLLTIVLRVLLIRPYRTQIVSQRRMQMVQPEVRAIQQRYKGDRNRISQEQMRLYKERGVSPAAGCLPAILQFALLVPMYQVIREGLSAPNIDSMLRIAGNQLFAVPCQDPANPLVACINPTVHWLLGLNGAVPEVVLWLMRNPDGTGFGLSILAILSSLLQLIQTRMVTPATSDPQQRAQQRTFLFLPLISLVYGGFLPAGLFLYWIASTLFAIVQQYLMVGWGSLFPIFGWTPPFAVEHSPRFPIAFAAAGAASGGAGSGGNAIAAPPPRTGSALDRAAGTVRPSKQRGRTSRRGRRR